jgi:hypothetical protein
MAESRESQAEIIIQFGKLGASLPAAFGSWPTLVMKIINTRYNDIYCLRLL